MSANPEVAMDAIVNIAQQMNESKRNELSRVLLALNSTNERASSSSGEEGSEPSRTNSVASSTT